jgi:RNA polymerase sigma-70 factor (ECF subfamily)
MKPNDAFPALVDELRALAAHLLSGERASHTLQPTALVNEAYLRLAGHGAISFEDRAHFVRTAIQAMNHVLIDHARGRKRLKRGGTAKRLGLEEADASPSAANREYEPEDLVELNEALQSLMGEDPQMVAVVQFRVVAGWEMKEIAKALGVSERTAYNDWAAAKARLRRLLAEG